MKNLNNQKSNGKKRTLKINFNIVLFLFISTLLLFSCQKEALVDMESSDSNALQKEEVEETYTDSVRIEELFPSSLEEAINISAIIRLDTSGIKSQSRSSSASRYNGTYTIGYKKWKLFKLKRSEMYNPLTSKVFVEITPIYGNPDLFIHGYDKDAYSRWRLVRYSANPGISRGGIKESLTFRKTDMKSNEEYIYFNIYGASATQFKVTAYWTNVDCVEYPSAELVQSYEKNEVCGCNGKTYANPSSAKNAGVTAWSEGRCRPKYTGSYGGNGGQSFLQLPTGGIHRIKKLSRIIVRYGKYVNSIQLQWELNNGQFPISLPAGEPGGKIKVVELEEGEYITKVTGRYGAWLDQISFQTNKYRIIGPFGGNGGRPFQLEVPNGVVGFYGRSGKYIDRLGIIYR